MAGTAHRDGRHWRTVRVFVSSTFRDMHAERHALVRVVFPALRERLARHRVHLIDVDLRWGVTREQAEHDGAVGVCLDQVDQCRPFFIGILGDRYGWVPRHVPAAAARRWPWLAEFPGRSVTELEMQHGALRQPRSASQAFFYFREPVERADLPEDARSTYLERDDNRQRRVADLKASIRAYGAPVMDGYRCRWDPTSPDTILQRLGRLVLGDEFAQRIERDLWEGLRAHIGVDDEQADEARSATAPTEADLLEAEADDYDRFVASRLQVYVGRDDIHRRLCECAVRSARRHGPSVGHRHGPRAGDTEQCHERHVRRLFSRRNASLLRVARRHALGHDAARAQARLHGSGGLAHHAHRIPARLRLRRRSDGQRRVAPQHGRRANRAPGRV